MEYTYLFLFFFGAIGVFNSFLICVYFLFIKKPKQLVNTLFGFFLFFISERSFRSLIYFYSTSAPSTYSSKFGPVSFLFIGPFLLLYVLSIVNPKGKAIARWKHHIFVWLIIAVVTHFVYPFSADPIFYKKYVLKVINLQWLFYILFSGWIVYKKTKSDYSKKKEFSSMNFWLSLLILAVLILWLLYFFVSFTYFVVGSITFSILFYSFLLYFVFNKKTRSQIFKGSEKYADKKIDSEKAAKLMHRLESLMQEHKPYKNPKLKMHDIAKELNLPSHQFSQLLNDNFGKSFSGFINGYRIEEAKQMIRSNTSYTLEAIGNESGFNSKSTFFTTFKRSVGMTPAKYKAQF